MVGVGARTLAEVIENRPNFRPWHTLNQVFDKWIEGLSLWLKPDLRPHCLAPIQPVWIREADGKWIGWTNDGDELVSANDADAMLKMLSTYPYRPRRLMLESKVVARAQVELPLAVFDRLRHALRFEIDRLTPFSQSEAAFDVRTLALAVSENQMTAELVVVPLAHLNPLLEESTRMFGVTLNGVDVADVDGKPMGVNLLNNPVYMVRPLRQLHWSLFALSVLMLCFSAWRSIENVRTQADSVEAELKPKTERARELSFQRRQFDNLIANTNAVQRERLQRSDITTVTNALAAQLPSNVFVERMSLVKNEIKLTGRGADNMSISTYLTENAFWGESLISAAGMSGSSPSFEVSMQMKPRSLE